MGFLCFCKKKKENAAGDEADFGSHDIGLIGSLALLINNITGAGMTTLPAMFQQAGWLFPMLCFIAISIWSILSSLYMSRAIQEVPGNKRFQKRVEFGNMAHRVFPRGLFLFTICTLVFVFIAQNISNVVVSSQVMDSTLIATAGTTCGLRLYPDPKFLCIGRGDQNSSDGDPQDSPFGDAYMISFGYIILAIISLPLGFLNLDDNIGVQIGAYIGLLTCLAVWVAQFATFGLESSRVPVSNSAGAANVIPTIMFNYGFVATVPSWLNEKGSNVSVTRSILIAVVVSTVLFLILGLVGAMGVDPALLGDNDILTLFGGDSLPDVWLISKIMTYLFPVLALVSSIPIFSILIRYNLMNSHLMSRRWSNVVAVAVPWLASLFFYAGNQLNDLMNWSSALLFVQLNLLLPVLMYMAQAKGRNTQLRSDEDEGLDHSLQGEAPSTEGRSCLAACCARLRRVRFQYWLDGLDFEHVAEEEDEQLTVSFPHGGAPDTPKKGLAVPLLLIPSELTLPAADPRATPVAKSRSDSIADLEEAPIVISLPRERYDEVSVLPEWCMRCGVTHARCTGLLLPVFVLLAVASLVLQTYSQFQ